MNSGKHAILNLAVLGATRRPELIVRAVRQDIHAVIYAFADGRTQEMG